jgi:uncharacterized membrane protein YeiH
MHAFAGTFATFPPLTRAKRRGVTPPLLPVPIEPLLWWLNIAGLAVFAVSGALVAARKRLDLVGAMFFALITAVGGGTVRDLLIGAPVFWMRDAAPVLICVGTALLVWIVPRRLCSESALDWFDAGGLAAYAVYGASKALAYGIDPVPAAVMGAVTACVGGIIRDIVSGEPSILLRHELYVTPAILAAGLFVLLHLAGLPVPLAMTVGTLAGFTLRGAAIRWKLAFPPYREGRRRRGQPPPPLPLRSGRPRPPSAGCCRSRRCRPAGGCVDRLRPGRRPGRCPSARPRRRRHRPSRACRRNRGGH